MTTPGTPARPLPMDVFSDIACPWCFIGKRRLARATVDGPPLTVRWRAYQLQPDLPPEGADMRELLVAKFGGEARMRQIFERVSEVGRAEGITFDLLGQKRSPNTRLAHEAVRFASVSGRGDAAKEALFRGHFEEREDVGRVETIAELFVRHEVGVDTTELRRALADGDHRAEVASDLALARQIGVTGVPFFILAGKLGMSGAQEVEVFRTFLAEGLQSVGAEG